MAGLDRGSMGESVEFVIRDGATGKVKRRIRKAHGSCVDLSDGGDTEYNEKDISDFIDRVRGEQFAINQSRRPRYV